jgi:sialidase-1
VFHRILVNAGECGYKYFRVPSMLCYEDTAVVMMEARTGGDWNDSDILLLRSIDRGETWDQHILVNARGTGGPVSNVVPIHLGGGDCCILFMWGYRVMFRMFTRDFGKTFTEVEQIHPFSDYRGLIATGPTHGIRTSGGRLLVPIWLAPGEKKDKAGYPSHGNSSIATVASDDAGYTWYRGEQVPCKGILNPSEASLAEIEDGSIWMNFRSEHPSRNRCDTTSLDGLSGWSSPRVNLSLPDPICAGSILSIDDGYLLINPAHRSKRCRLTVRYSQFGGYQRWPHSRIVKYGQAGYSDIGVFGNGEIACVYEAGMMKRADVASIEFRRFNLEWVKGTDRSGFTKRIEATPVGDKSSGQVTG